VNPKWPATDMHTTLKAATRGSPARSSGICSPTAFEDTRDAEPEQGRTNLGKLSDDGFTEQFHGRPLGQKLEIFNRV
jgi:hypothetical protein